MKRRRSKARGAVSVLAALVVLVTSAGVGRADPALDQADPPRPLPEKIVAAWKEAGARFCWARPDKSGFIVFLPEGEAEPGDLPAFRFLHWHGGRVEQLPVPELPFGLDLSDTRVTDAGLKELAGKKSLQLLSLHDTPVTDAGLKELSGLTNLQTLNLERTQVTNAGMKDLAGLTSLQSLDLYHTHVDDAGLKDVAGLTSLKSLYLSDLKVTDTGLKALARLTGLKLLYLNGTLVTDEGIEANWRG